MCHFPRVTYLIFKRDYGDHGTTPDPEISDDVPFLFLSLEMHKIQCSTCKTCLNHFYLAITVSVSYFCVAKSREYVYLPKAQHTLNSPQMQVPVEN